MAAKVAGEVTRYGDQFLAKAYLDAWQEKDANGCWVCHSVVRQKICDSEFEAEQWIVNSIEGYKIKQEAELSFYFG